MSWAKLLASLSRPADAQAVLEAGGATGLAAVLSNKLPDVKGKTICIIASGGNLSLEKYMRTISRM